MAQVAARPVTSLEAVSAQPQINNTASSSNHITLLIIFPFTVFPAKPPVEAGF
jgi:hypothetical protein